MKTNEFLNLIRKVVRDEVRTVLREELYNLEKPTISENRSIKNLVKDIPVKKEIKSTGNPITDILQETAAEGSWRTLINATSPMAPNFSSMMPNVGGYEPKVTTVEGFLQQAGPVKDINQVKIDAVPDYRAIMGKLKEQGKI
jgi:hypothetical protein